MKIYIVTKTENSVQLGVIEHCPNSFFTQDEAIKFITCDVANEVSLGKIVRKFFISENKDIYIYDIIDTKVFSGVRMQYYIWEVVL